MDLNTNGNGSETPENEATMAALDQNEADIKALSSKFDNYVDINTKQMAQILQLISSNVTLTSNQTSKDFLTKADNILGGQIKNIMDIDNPMYYEIELPMNYNNSNAYAKID